MKRVWLGGMLILVLILAACASDGGSTSAETEGSVETAADAELAESTEAEADAEAEVEAETETEDEAAAEGSENANEEAEASGDEAESAEAESTGDLRTFAIVTEESSASYIVDETFLSGALDRLGITPGDYDIRGTTEQINGQLELNLGDLSAPLGNNQFTVNLTGLSSDQDRRDNWLRENPDGPQFGQFATAEFVATEISGGPDSYSEGESTSFQMTGDMTIRETTQPLTFDVVATLEGDTIRGTAVAESLLSDWGINPPNFAGTLTVEDPFIIEVEFTATE